MRKGEQQEILAYLRNSPLFSVLSEDQIQSISQLSVIEEYPPKTLVLKEGDPSTQFYLILDGQVEIHNPKGEARRLGRGDYFGETTLVSNLTKSASVLTVSKSRCLVLAGSDLRSYPSVVLRLLDRARLPDRNPPLPSSNKESVASITHDAYPTERVIQFQSERAKRVFDYAVRNFIQDYMVKRLYSEQAGWRSYGEVSAGTNIPRDSLYGRNGKPGPAIAELLSRGLVETRVFAGGRGRGGEVVKVRIAYDKEPVKRYVDSAVLGRKP